MMYAVIHLPINLNWLDFIDIFLITFVVYQLYSLFSNTRGFRILIGLLGLGITYALVKSWGLFLSTWVFQIFWQVLIIFIIIVFQPEIREVLEKVNLFNLIHGKKRLPPGSSMIDTVSRSAFRMADEGIGAIIVFKQRDYLRSLIHDGIPLDGQITEPILLSIFQKSSPIHDGAILIDGDRIKLVGGYLPLTERDNLPSRYGSRHRASLGLSERSDAFVVVVSETRREVSVVQRAEIKRVRDQVELSRLIREHITMRERRERLTVRKIISKAALANWPKKLTTFLLVFFVYIILAGQQNYSQSLLVPIEYKNVPPKMEMVSPPKNAKIFIKGLRKQVASLRAEMIRIEVDVSLAQWGRRTFNISEGDLNLPSGIQLEYIDPSVIRLDFR
ncbi:MAG: diadenylate cyclase [bacterium]